MKGAGRNGLTLAAVVAAAAGGYWEGKRDFVNPAFRWIEARVPFQSVVSQAAEKPPPASGPVIYFQDPDGRPAYAAAPTKTADGRDFRPVLASEDISFADAQHPVVPATMAAEPRPSGTSTQILYYRNPMGLPDKSPVPKKDSMGMDYIPVLAGEQEDGSTITLSPGKLQRTGVRAEPAAMRTLTVPIRTAGTIQLDERRKSVIALRFDGYVERVENITTGTMVRQGQLLMHVYGPELLAPAAQYLSALNDRTDTMTLKNARRRLENLAVPESVIAEIERTHEIPPTLAWPAPRSGIVVERTAVDGMKASAGESLFRLADISVVWALADIPEGDLPSIAVGQSVTVKPRGSARTYSGKIGLIYPSINPQTRTARVRIELPNPDGALMPDMYAAVEIATGGGKPVLTVADSAVIDTGDRQMVIIDKGEGHLEPRPVKIGRRGDGFVEIKDGVAEGDRVVVAANFLIDAESNLKAALNGLTATGEAK